MMWLRIAGSPPRNFYTNADAIPYLPEGEARHELLTQAGTLRSGTDGETPNISLTLRNGSAQCARLFAVPPLGQQADLMDETGILFTGIIKRIALGTDCSVEVQA